MRSDYLSTIWSRTKPPHLLLFAAVWHLAVTVSIFIVGRFQLMPAKFDSDGLGAFADDGFLYRGEITSLTAIIKSQGLWALVKSPSQLHVKLYAVDSALFGWASNFNILTIEPLNLIYYLTILVLCYQLGHRLFNQRAGLIAAGIVAVWPSFVLHTTQLLRDPLLTLAALALCLMIVNWLARTDSWRMGLLSGVIAALAVVTIWIVRLSMWDLVRAIAGLGLVFLLLRQVRERRILLSGMIGVTLLMAAVIITPRYHELFAAQQRSIVLRYKPQIAEKLRDASMLERLMLRRQAFVEDEFVAAAASNIDKDLKFNNWLEVLRYLPRAALIGFFAPFPNMWFASGNKVGASGRLLSGFESLLTYFIWCVALVGLWRKRRSLGVWWVTLTIAMGMTGLGLVVLNMGALYRMRYVFWMLLVVLGAGGLQSLIGKRRQGQAGPTQAPALDDKASR